MSKLQLSVFKTFSGIRHSSSHLTRWPLTFCYPSGKTAKSWEQEIRKVWLEGLVDQLGRDTELRQYLGCRHLKRDLRCAVSPTFCAYCNERIGFCGGQLRDAKGDEVNLMSQMEKGSCKRLLQNCRI